MTNDDKRMLLHEAALEGETALFTEKLRKFLELKGLTPEATDVLIDIATEAFQDGWKRGVWHGMSRAETVIGNKLEQVLTDAFKKEGE